MSVNIQFSQSYFRRYSWILENIIQLDTQNFCDRFIDYKIDPDRRLYDQMVMAVRCGVGKDRKIQSIERKAPLCPDCRNPMIRRMQKKGKFQGREFWGCSDYPNCKGIREIMNRD